MNLKSKIFGTIAASAIALSMSVGIASADDSASGTAVLNPATCSVNFNGGGFNLGDWWWNGDEYAGDATTGSATAKVVAPDAVSKCTMTVAFSGLTYGSASIPANYFSISGTGDPANSTPGIPTNFTNLPAGGFNASGIQAGNGEFTINLRLNDVPDTIPAGTYTGALAVTNVAAQ